MKKYILYGILSIVGINFNCNPDCPNSYESCSKNPYKAADVYFNTKGKLKYNKN